MNRLEIQLNEMKATLVKLVDDLEKKTEEQIHVLRTKIENVVGDVRDSFDKMKTRIDKIDAKLDELAAKWSSVVKLEGRVAELEKTREKPNEAA